jgi:hypothetical protein
MWVIARAQSRNNYFSHLDGKKVVTVTKKSEARTFDTRLAARNMCLTLSLLGYPSDMRKA